MATLAAVTNMPALALLGEDGRLEQSTEAFRRWYSDNEELCKQSPELQRVIDGQANAAVLKLDGIAVDIAAVSDRGGARHVLLTLPTDELPSLGDAGGALLDGALDESPAIVWLKDLEGRYVRVNSRFTTFLGTTEEKLLGRTDAELPPAETVDGPRLQEREGDVEEPLQLEYFVGPYQGRDALVVLRFPVGDAKGVPTLVCGVAAPSSEANVARSEAARLLRVERWSRLDAESVRAEMLAEWGVLPDARGRSAPAPTVGEPASGATDREQQAAVAEARAERATAVAERDAALTANEELAGELKAAQARLTELERKIADGDVERGRRRGGAGRAGPPTSTAPSAASASAPRSSNARSRSSGSASATTPRRHEPRSSAPAPTPTPRGPSSSARAPTPRRRGPTSRRRERRPRPRGRRSPPSASPRRAPGRRSSSRSSRPASTWRRWSASRAPTIPERSCSRPTRRAPRLRLRWRRRWPSATRR